MSRSSLFGRGRRTEHQNCARVTGQILRGEISQSFSSSPSWSCQLVPDDQSEKTRQHDAARTLHQRVHLQPQPGPVAPRKRRMQVADDLDEVRFHLPRAMAVMKKPASQQELGAVRPLPFTVVIARDDDRLHVRDFLEEFLRRVRIVRLVQRIAQPDHAARGS